MFTNETHPERTPSLEGNELNHETNYEHENQKFKLNFPNFKNRLWKISTRILLKKKINEIIVFFFFEQISIAGSLPFMIIANCQIQQLSIDAYYVVFL